MTIFSAAALLFLVMDPFGNIPLFISALGEVDRKRHVRIIIRELLIAFAVLTAFLFTGSQLLKMLQISESALSAAGGTVLLLIAIKMVFPRSGGGLAEETPSGEPFIVPMAIPYVAGPSALAVVLLIMSREPGRWPEWLAALSISWFFTGLILATSGALARRLGKKVLIAIERLMGMLLVAIAIQMIMTGVAQFMRSG